LSKALFLAPEADGGAQLVRVVQYCVLWVLNLESGNSKAEIGLILRAIEVLGLRATLIDQKQPARGPDLKIPRLDLVFQHLQGINYIVFERFDRLPPAPGSPFVRRVHQEDMCQALGILPGAKYQQDGGPGVADIVALIRRVGSNPSTDIDRFIDANAFNWLIGGTDAHAKNYSLLLGAENQVLLSPLYDLSSQLPYPELIDQRVSMKIGGEYNIPLIGLAEWRDQALACGLDAEALINRLRQMAEMLPDVIAAAREQALQDGLDRSFVTDLAAKLIKHASSRRAALQTVARHPRRKSR